MARDSDSYIFRRGVTPQTHSVISSKNRIYAVPSNATAAGKAGMTQIGTVSTFDPSESRTVEAVRGIGFGDQIAELVPGVTDPMTISVTRTAMYTSSIYQVFGYKAGIDGIVRSLKHHRWPFDIQQEVIFSAIANNKLDAGNSLDDATKGEEEEGSVEKGGGSFQALVTLYEACWMSDFSISYASDTALVQESVTINVSDILTSDADDSAYNDNKSFGNEFGSTRFN